MVFEDYMGVSGPQKKWKYVRCKIWKLPRVEITLYKGSRVKTHDDLSQHAQAHLGLAPFECLDCDYKTKNISALTNHMIEKTHMMEQIKGMDGMATRASFADKVKNNSRSRRK